MTNKEVMQMALIALGNVYATRNEVFHLDTMKALETALAQPESELVCLMVIKGEISYKSTAEDQSFGMWCPVNYDCNHSLPDGTKFYTSPPKREFVELTNVESYKLLEECTDPFELLSFTQDKLKEKNT